MKVNMRTCAMLLLALLIMLFGVACAATEVKSSPVASSTVIVSPTATASPIPASTAVTQSHLIRVDSFVCQRFFPGVPNPDGPNEWLNISGSITNPDVEMPLSLSEHELRVEVLDSSGAVVRTVPVTTDAQTLAPGATTTFNGEPVNEENPTASTCRIAFGNYASDDQTGPLTLVLGQATVEIEIFAAP